MNYLKFLITIICLFSFFVTKLSIAECLSDKKITDILKSSPPSPIEGINENITLEEAYCSQEKYVEFWKQQSQYSDAVIGYKVGFTGKATQEIFKINTPATGVLFNSMFLKNGSEISKNFGHRTLIEPDLLEIVKSSKIMKSTTKLEAAKYLDTIHPFMELPALQIKKGEAITGPVIVAINMLATKMVMGPGISIQANQTFINALESMETIFTDETGNIIQNSPGSTLLGNPLNVVLWLIKEFNQRGLILKAGDRISLGSVGKLFPLKESNKEYTYTLEGLPGGPSSTSIIIK